jgi:hypothetical protein
MNRETAKFVREVLAEAAPLLLFFVPAFVLMGWAVTLIAMNVLAK